MTYPTHPVHPIKEEPPGGTTGDFVCLACGGCFTVRAASRLDAFRGLTQDQGRCRPCAGIRQPLLRDVADLREAFRTYNHPTREGAEAVRSMQRESGLPLPQRVVVICDCGTVEYRPIQSWGAWAYISGVTKCSACAWLAVLGAAFDIETMRHALTYV